MINLISDFRKKMDERAVFGPFSKTCDSALIEITGKAGFDFVIIDLEHGPNSVQTAQSLIRAAQLSGVLPVVRVKEDMPGIIGEVLDIGAGGIQVPQISNASDVRKVIQRAKFAPDGMRGVCRFVRAAGYSSINRFQYFGQANEALVIIQLEGREALDNINGILSVKGIDVVFIGPYDLSQALGVTGNVDHPLVVKKMQEIVEMCNASGMKAGTFVDNMENAEKRMRLGVKYISYSVDYGIFYESCKSISERLKCRDNY